MASNPSTKPWGGGMGSWALEAEQAEAEQALEPPSQSFPSLKEAVAVKPKKKNKGTKLSLSEFTTGAHVGPGFGRSTKDPIVEAKGLTHEEILRLPTGPRERTAEEIEQGRHGGGFRNYGSYGGGGGGGRRDEGEGRRGYGGGFGEEGGRRGSGFEQGSSRADEVDNWGSGKKSLGGDMPRRGDRYENLGNGSGAGGGGGIMRADGADNWGAGKKQMFPNRSSGFGFHDSSSGSADSDRWARGGGGGGRDFGGGSGSDFGGGSGMNGDRVRTRLVLDPPKKDATAVVGGGGGGTGKTHTSLFGEARPREEVLAEKGVDWRKTDSEVETKKTSRPGSAQSGDSTSQAPSVNVNTVAAELGIKPRPKSNPFGDAKPREVLLEERGKDWRKIDKELEHRSIDRMETEEEKLLKEEISDLKKTLSKTGGGDGESTEHSSEEVEKLNDQIVAREKELEQVMLELDDKVKFGQKAVNEFGSGSRNSSFSDRPPSRSSIPDDSRSSNYMERPGSRGSVGDTWSRPQEERRGFRTGNREGGFFGNQRNRSLSRERW